MNMEEWLLCIRTTPGCRVNAPAGLPAIEAPHRLPDDVRTFYQLCGGLSLAENSPTLSL